MSNVVVLDYPGPGHEDRIKSLDLGHQVLDELRPRDVAIGPHVQRLVDRAGQQCRLVVAYCAATTIGREFARLTNARFIAVNPETPVPQEVLDLARDVGGSPALSGIAAMEPVLVERYDADLGGDLPLARELAAAQLDWICHLAAAADPDAGAVSPDEVHVTSTDHACPPDCPAGHMTVDADNIFDNEQVRELLREEVRNAE
jgi:hypothetical protein